MLLSRVLGTVGRTFIALGVLTLLFVAYQLWGTGLLTAQAQGALEDDFEESVAEAETAVAVVAELEAAAASGDAEAIAAAEEAAEQARFELAELIWKPRGDAVAKLLIPDINVSWTVVSGVGVDDLQKGPGHYPGTPMPGMPGNASIAGHRTTWGAPFNRIDELDPGDEITVQTAQGVFTYRVVPQENGKGHFIVSPDRVDVLDQDFIDTPDRLTLTACHPKFSARQRIIVVAELVDEPAEFIPRPESLGEVGAPELAAENVDGEPETTSGQTVGEDDLPGDPDVIAAEAEADEDAASEGAEDDEDDAAAVPAAASDPTAGLEAAEPNESFGEGLNGDREAILPAVLWGLAALTIWMAAAFGAARLRDRQWVAWPSWAVGAIAFVPVLFICFVYIDKSIPSY